MTVTLTQNRPFGVVERSGDPGLLARVWIRFAPQRESAESAQGFLPNLMLSPQRIILNPKPSAKTDQDWAILQSLDPNHPLRRTIEGKVAVKQAAMEQLHHGREVSDRAAFNALWRQMNQHSKGNLLSQNLHAALSVPLLNPASAQGNRNESKLTAQPQSRAHKAYGASEAISHSSTERNPNAAARQHHKLKETAKRVADIKRGLETADAPELAYRVNEAREVAAAYGLKDPVLIRQAERMGAQAEDLVGIEARSRLGGRASMNGDIERDLRQVQKREDAEKARLNEAALALTPVGLARGIAHAMAGKSGGRG